MELRYNVYSKKYKKTYEVVFLDLREQTVTYYKSERFTDEDGNLCMQQGDYTEKIQDVKLILVKGGEK